MSWNWPSMGECLIYGGPLDFYKLDHKEVEPMKMNIDRLKLIEAIKAKQAALQTERKKVDDEAEKARSKFLKEYTAALKEHLADVGAGRFDPAYGPSFKYFNTHSWPQKYYDNRHTKDFSHLIAQLELAEDKVLTLDDKSDYFEFLR